jgi:predicted nucleic acid-binding protein
MILVDANLLIYAIDQESIHHAKAHTWVEKILSETTPVGIAWIVVLAFLRITTLTA